MRESSGVASGLSSLPSGGGGIEALGERFQPDLVRGTGSYAVPFSLPFGPNELRPALTLTYSTGSGNGPFGLGWRLNSLRIERRTDRGIPKYDDDDEFVIGDAEVLVPVGDNRFRPKVDTRFWHIVREDEQWIVRTGDGRILHFGQTEASRELDGERVFAWYLDSEIDPAGNTIRYHYHRDGNRLYLQEIRYSIFRVALSYEPRPDVLRNGRAGFLRSTAQRAAQLVIHSERLAPTTMRTYSFGYTEADNGISLLSHVELSAEAGGETASFPELRFSYAQANFSEWTIDEPTARIAPPKLNDSNAQLVDLTGNALPDVLQSFGTRLLLWRNQGDGRFEGPSRVENVPSTIQLSRQNVAFADLNGNGRVDLFAVDQPLQLAYESDGRGGFQPEPLFFRQRPDLGLAAGNTRLMDINGDGVTDLISTERDHLLLYTHEPGVGWQEPLAIRRNHNLAEFPDLSFEQRGVYLADMTGDGLQDFVLLQSGRVSYWPYLGHGRWGARVIMQQPPQLPSGYREERLHLLDMDGSGSTDVVYVDFDGITIWLNRAGNGFSPPLFVPVTTGADGTVLAADFFGEGRLSLAWDSTVNRLDSTGFRVLRFGAGEKPYLMSQIDNGMGGRFEMSYSNSTAMRLADQHDGAPWQHQLPFVVNVVSQIREVDLVSERVSEMRMRYHDGVYDGPEREFRGFSKVTVDAIGDESIPTSRQEITFFQGDPEHSNLLERARQRALAGSTEITTTLEQIEEQFVVRHSSSHRWEVRLEHEAGNDLVFFPFVTEIEAREHSLTGAPARIERTHLLDYNAYGNPTRRLRESFAEHQPSTEWIRSEERYTYTENENDWLVRLPVRLELRDGEGTPFAVRITHYDGPALLGLAEGQASHGLATRVLELQLLESRLPLDYVGTRDFAALGYELLGTGDTRGYYATTMAYQRDNLGNVITQHGPLGHDLTIEYDHDGLYPLRSTDSIGRVTQHEFNPRAGEPSQTELPDGRMIRNVHDAIGRLRAIFESDNDGALQLTKVWRIDVDNYPSSVTSIVINQPGRDLAEFGPNVDLNTLGDVSVSKIYYDGFGNENYRVTTAPDALDGTSRLMSHARPLLNPRGLTHTQLPPQFVSNLDFVVAGSVSAAAIRSRYDVFGNVSETIGPDPVQHRVMRDTFQLHHFDGPTQSRTEHFDARNRLIQIDEFNDAASTITTHYDLALDGRIAAIRDGTGQVKANYVFAGPGEAIQINHRDVGTRTYYRNAVGLVVERIDVDGSRLFYSYDALRRLVRIEHSAVGSDARSVIREIVYDADASAPQPGQFLDGRVALVRELDNTIRYSYNRAGQAVRESVTTDGTTLTVERDFDLQGRLTAVIYPDGTRHDITLDSSGSATAVAGLIGAVNYNEDGVVAGYHLANGVQIQAEHDPVSRRLNSLSALSGTDTLRRLDYDYDAIGNIIALTDRQPGNVEQNLFTYDGLHRLQAFAVHANDSNGILLRSGQYQYDDDGNLQQFPEVEPLSLTYGDALHPGRITAVNGIAGATPVSYDGRGNLTTMGDLSQLEYDPLGRLVRVVKTDGTELNLAYDHQGQRILKRVIENGLTRRVRYIAGLYEAHETHSLRHLIFGKRLLATDRVTPGEPTTRAYYFSDHHGTLLMSSDESGAVIHQQRYTPFGLARDSSTALDFYLGRETDVETGLLQLGARYYAPRLGRFISPDWYVLENPTKPIRMPQGYNVYSYALNNPLVFKDPSGMWFLIDDLIVAAAGFVVGFVTGLVHGLVNGQGWGSFLTALETGLTTGAGAWLGWNVAGPFGAIMGGMNGLISGVNGIYDWKSAEGWFAFISDSTWGLIGTSLGNVVHVVNLFYDDANYRTDFSRRQNRHVYEGGLALKSDFAFTLGNVISNAGLGGSTINADFIARHEELHVWQSRLFGPLYQTTYVVWAIGGFFVGTVVWFFNTDENWWSLVETAAYYDNPFEYWAYSNDENWPPGGANPLLTY